MHIKIKEGEGATSITVDDVATILSIATLELNDKMTSLERQFKEGNHPNSRSSLTTDEFIKKYNSFRRLRDIISYMEVCNE